MFRALIGWSCLWWASAGTNIYLLSACCQHLGAALVCVHRWSVWNQSNKSKGTFKVHLIRHRSRRNLLRNLAHSTNSQMRLDYRQQMLGSDLITFGFISVTPEKCVFTTFLFYLKKEWWLHTSISPQNHPQNPRNQRSILSRSLGATAPSSGLEICDARRRILLIKISITWFTTQVAVSHANTGARVWICLFVLGSRLC